VLEKQDYLRVLRRIEAKYLNQKIEFFQQLPFLRHQTTNTLKKLMLSFNPLKFKRNQIVYSQGSKSSHVYLVECGEFEVIRNNTVTKAQQKYRMSQQKILKMLGPENQDCLTNNKEFSTDKKTVTHKITIALVSRGHIVGQEDVMSNRPYTTTVKCVSGKGVVYCIKAEEFNIRLGKDEKAWGMLTNITKQQDRVTRLKIF